MRISFLSNSLLVLPSVQYLLSEQVLSGLAAPLRNAMLCEQFSRLAVDAGIPFQSIRLDHLETDLLQWIAATSADAVVVQTFPRKIPETCLKKPPRGFFNLHPGPLPGYRGPDPVFWQLAHGSPEAVVTLHKMDEDYDTGAIVRRERIPVLPTDTYGHVQSNIAFTMPSLLNMLIRYLGANDDNLARIQSNENACFHPKPGVSDLIVDWNGSTSHDIHNLIRACNPNQNGALSFFRDVLVRLLEAAPLQPEFSTKLSPGTVIAADAVRGLQVVCSDGMALRLNVLHVDEGYYSGAQFCEVFEVKLGEKFSMPSFLS